VTSRLIALLVRREPRLRPGRDVYGTVPHITSEVLVSSDEKDSEHEFQWVPFRVTKGRIVAVGIDKVMVSLITEDEFGYVDYKG